MNVDLPEEEQLLKLRSIAQYGDEVYRDVSGRKIENAGGEPYKRGGALHLSAVLPALSSAIGRPVGTAVHDNPKALQDALGLPDCRSAIVVLVDGLGYWNLNARIGHAPYLRSLMKHESNQRPISTCSPSTTTAAMGTFGTGTCPGLTAMTGYTQINPHTGALAQLIQFKESIKPRELQRQPTVFESLTDQGVTVTSSGLPKFADSPLTEAALRGTHYVGSITPSARIRVADQAASLEGLTYLYMRDLDKNGHSYGWQSDQWVGALEKIDAQLDTLRRNAPRGTLIVIIADHGMIETDPSQCVDIAAIPQLNEGVSLLGGEPRMTMLYLDHDADPSQVASRWQDTLEDKALVLTRLEAMESGLYGPVDQRVEPMIGDVIVCAAQRATVIDSRVQSDAATHLAGAHGSLSAMEMDIPCLVDLT